MKEKNNIIKEDFEVLKFLSKYKMLKVEDASLIYKTKRYYRQRVNKLIDKEYVKRYKSYIIIDKKGRQVLNEVGSNYIKNIKNEAYMERLRHIASIATLTLNSDIKFIPSWDMKEKDKFTETARRYIGKIIIDGKDYITYYISNQKEHIYIKQLLFDVKKTTNYEDVIIFVENLNVINKKYSNLSFGKENTHIIVNSNNNKEFLKSNSNINAHDLLEVMYEKEVYISDWDKANYLLENGTYILYMPFINTEKIERLNWYYEENTGSNRVIEILTLNENKEKVRELLCDKCKIRTFDKDLFGGEIEKTNNQSFTKEKNINTTIYNSSD